MSIEFKEGNYYLGMWFFNLPKKLAENGGDFMACVYRDDIGDKKWHLKYRFRYYEGDDPSPFNDPDDPNSTIDRKNWYHASMPGDIPVTEMQSKNDEAMNALCNISGSKMNYFHIGGGMDVVMKLFRDPAKCPPWMHSRQIHMIDEDGTTAA